MVEQVNNTGSPIAQIRDVKAKLEPLLYKHETITEGYEAQIVALADQLQSACKADLEAALATIVLDAAISPFALNHSVNVALLAGALGMREQWPGDEVEATVCAALTMNVSYAAQQDTLTGLNTDLTLLQKSSIESHARLSHKVLTQKKIKNRDWLNAVMQHHERTDGTGPLGMRGDSISKIARAIGLADRFCVLAAYHGGGDAALTPRFVRQTVRHELDESTTRDLVADSLGAYMPGTMVNLASGEVGIVWRYTDDKRHPLVSSLGMPGALALGEGTVRDTREKDYDILEALDLRVVYKRSKLLQLWGFDDAAAAREPHAASAA